MIEDTIFISVFCMAVTILAFILRDIVDIKIKTDMDNYKNILYENYRFKIRYLELCKKSNEEPVSIFTMQSAKEHLIKIREKELKK